MVSFTHAAALISKGRQQWHHLMLLHSHDVHMAMHAGICLRTDCVCTASVPSLTIAHITWAMNAVLYHRYDKCWNHAGFVRRMSSIQIALYMHGNSF